MLRSASIDVKTPVETDFSGSERMRHLKATALQAVQARPWLKALALTQRGSLIFMVKRS